MYIGSEYDAYSSSSEHVRQELSDNKRKRRSDAVPLDEVPKKRAVAKRVVKKDADPKAARRSSNHTTKPPARRS